jgi:hypothetical protein
MYYQAWFCVKLAHLNEFSVISRDKLPASRLGLYLLPPSWRQHGMSLSIIFVPTGSPSLLYILRQNDAWIEPHVRRPSCTAWTKIRKLQRYSCSCSSPRHENVWWGGGIAPRTINLDTRWRWAVSFMPRPLYPFGKAHCKEAGWAPMWALCRQTFHRLGTGVICLNFGIKMR